MTTQSGLTIKLNTNLQASRKEETTNKSRVRRLHRNILAYTICNHICIAWNDFPSTEHCGYIENYAKRTYNIVRNRFSRTLFHDMDQE